MSDKEVSAQRGAAARRDAETLHSGSPAGLPANLPEQGVSDAAQASVALPLGGNTPVSKLRRNPLRKWGLLVALVLLLAGALYWGFSSHLAGLKAGKHTSQQQTATAGTSYTANPAQKAASSAEPEAVTPADTLESALGLALQGVNLFSGEKGAELWRLKASWAHLSRENNEILVDLPVVRYTMGDPVLNAGADPVASMPSATATQQTVQDTVPADYLDVKSEKGKITDSQRYLTLWGNVDVRRFEDILTGPRMEYDSKTRVMVFPEGAFLESPKAQGEAARLTWNLASNELMAEGGVVVVLKAEPLVEPPSPTPLRAVPRALPSAASTVSKPTSTSGKSGR